MVSHTLTYLWRPAMVSIFALYTLIFYFLELPISELLLSLTNATFFLKEQPWILSYLAEMQ